MPFCWVIVKLRKFLLRALLRRGLAMQRVSQAFATAAPAIGLYRVINNGVVPLILYSMRVTRGTNIPVIRYCDTNRALI